MKTVILTILVFGVIIMLHESGHFLFAKLFHVKVEEFSFGMGPKLWSRIKRGTQYTPSGVSHRRLCGHGRRG